MKCIRELNMQLRFFFMVILSLVFSSSAYGWVNQGYKYSSTRVSYEILSGTPSNVEDAWASASDDWYDGNTSIQFTERSSAVNTCGHVYLSDIADRGWMDPYKTATIIQSFDAVINTWYSSGTSNRNYRSTANHELGHVLGLGHETFLQVIMNGNRNLNTVYTPKPDDVTGVNYLYGL